MVAEEACLRKADHTIQCKQLAANDQVSGDLFAELSDGVAIDSGLLFILIHQRCLFVRRLAHGQLTGDATQVGSGPMETSLDSRKSAMREVCLMASYGLP